MSIILDALKKAEKNRQNPQAKPQAMFNAVPAPAFRKRRLPLLPLATLVFALVLYVRLPLIKKIIMSTAEKTRVMARQTFPKAETNPDIIKTEALRLYEQGNLEESEKKWKELIKISPDNAEAYNNLGVVLKKSGQSDLAKEFYEKALSLNPVYPQALNNLGVLEDPSQAITTFNKAILADPKYAEPYFHLALLLEKGGQVLDAASQYQRFLDLDPTIDSKLKGQIKMRILKLKTAPRE